MYFASGGELIQSSTILLTVRQFRAVAETFSFLPM
jgi:hypothetical protein